MNSIFSNWIKDITGEANLPNDGKRYRQSRHVPTTLPTKNQLQLIDYKRNTDKPDRYRHVLRGGGAHAPRLGAAQEKYSAEILTNEQLKFWQQAINEAAYFLNCSESDKAMMHSHLIERGWLYVIPLRDLVRAYGLPISRQPAFKPMAKK